MLLELIRSMDDTLPFFNTWYCGKAILILSGQFLADFCHIIFISMMQSKEEYPEILSSHI